MSIATAVGRESIVEHLNGANAVRMILLAGGALPPHEIEKAFHAMADAGEWNRVHPTDRIEPVR